MKLAQSSGAQESSPQDLQNAAGDEKTEPQKEEQGEKEAVGRGTPSPTPFPNPGLSVLILWCPDSPSPTIFSRPFCIRWRPLGVARRTALQPSLLPRAPPTYHLERSCQEPKPHSRAQEPCVRFPAVCYPPQLDANDLGTHHAKA